MFHQICFIALFLGGCYRSNPGLELDDVADADVRPLADHLLDDGGPPDLAPADLSHHHKPHPPHHQDVGRPCEGPSDCDVGFCWRSPSGKGICTQACVRDRQCGPEARCIEYPTGDFCTLTCQTDSACPSGFTCLVQPDRSGLCLPGCRFGRDCR